MYRKKELEWTIALLIIVILAIVGYSFYFASSIFYVEIILIVLAIVSVFVLPDMLLTWLLIFSVVLATLFLVAGVVYIPANQRFLLLITFPVVLRIAKQVNIHRRTYLSIVKDYSEQAKELYEILKQHDLGLDRKSYAEETALLKKLIESLNNPNNQSKLRAVSLDMTYEELKRKQMDFERLYSEQIEANAELRMEKSASSLRKDLENTLRNYLKYIDAMKSVPNYKELYYELNELLKKERV